MSREHILDAAIYVARRSGLRGITRKAVATRAKVANGTVSYHFVTMEKLLDAVMREAVAIAILPLIAEGLTLGHRRARLAPQELKDAAAKLLTA